MNTPDIATFVRRVHRLAAAPFSCHPWWWLWLWLALALGVVLGWTARGATKFGSFPGPNKHRPWEQTYSKPAVGAVPLHHSARRKPQDANLLKNPV